MHTYIHIYRIGLHSNQTHKQAPGADQKRHTPPQPTPNSNPHTSPRPHFINHNLTKRIGNSLAVS